VKLVLISDIHSNLEAFERVLQDINSQEYDNIICLGDIVGYGPDPVECIDIIRDNEIQCLMGNHDASVCGILSSSYFNIYAKKAVEWTADVLSENHIEYLKNLPFVADFENMLFIHGALNEPFDYILDQNSLNKNIEILKNEYPNKNFCFFGHTHVPFISRDGTFEYAEQGKYNLGQTENNIFFINPGSVGQPRGGMTNKSSYCIYNTETNELTYKNVEYDIDKTFNKIKKLGLPEYLGQRLYEGI
jgi:predicted phosphodiesterase